MNEKELASLYYINIELRRIEKHIYELKAKIRDVKLSEAAVSAINIDGVPHGNSPGDPTSLFVINKIALYNDLETQLNEELKRYAAKQLEYEKRKATIEEYIDSISDQEIQTIFKCRCIERMKWHEIGEILSMNRRTASKKYYDYIKNVEKN